MFFYHPISGAVFSFITLFRIKRSRQVQTIQKSDKLDDFRGVVHLPFEIFGPFWNQKNLVLDGHCI
jgi:hypothetical protein